MSIQSTSYAQGTNRNIYVWFHFAENNLYHYGLVDFHALSLKGDILLHYAEIKIPAETVSFVLTSLI